jgi:hypothetical protein
MIMTYTQVWDRMTNAVSDKLILRDEDQAWIPSDLDNKDYQAYLKWLKVGNTPNPYEPPVTSKK